MGNNTVLSLPTKTTVTHKTVTVTPEIAQKYMLSNTRNRELKADNLRVLRAHMLGNTFESLNGQTIVFSNTGVLLDGQHRLQALIETNSTYDFVVIEGVDEDAFTTIDIGVKRKTRDIFQIEGIDNATGISAAVTHYMKLKNKINTLSNGVIYYYITMDDVLEAYKNHAHIFQSTYKRAMEYHKKMKIFSISQLAGLMAYTALHSRFNNRAIEEFWNPLFTGTNLSEQVNVLRSKYIQSLGIKSKTVTLQHKTAWLIIAYNNHFSNKCVQRIIWQGPKLPEFL